MSPVELSEDERRTLWTQFVEVHTQSQESFDASVRTLAAAGVGVTASLAVALEGFDGLGVAAVFCFVGSLALNLGSFLTAQLDMGERLNSLRSGDFDGIYRNRWSRVTSVLNLVAGLALVCGAGLLAAFVASAA